MLAELQSLEREDRATRQKSLAKMPVSISLVHCTYYRLCAIGQPSFSLKQTNMFQPTHQRIEMASEQQREMEGAFERLFVRRQQGEAIPSDL